MSQQPLPDPHQQLNINDASIQNSQIGQAGRDLTLVRGEVVNLTVYDRVDVSSLLGRRASGTVEPLTQQEYRQRKVLLNKVKKFWIEGVLEKSIHTKALIELGLEERLDLVERPFGEVQEIPNESRQTLSSSTGVTQVFDQMGEGRTLLILGEPGAGKTTMLLKLAQDLIASTEQDLSQPIPVVFNLSSWVSKQRTIADWLVQELNSKYQVPNFQGKVWVKDQQLLLLLDGLDEVKADYRESCIRALNQFIQEHGQTEIVVCSRIRDYEALSIHLKFQSAVCIQLLTSKQVNNYLEKAGDQLEAVRILLQEDNTLQELAHTPLILSVLTIAYQGISVQDLPKVSSLEEYRRHLFDTYIERMFFRRQSKKQRYAKERAKRWLIWLGKKMSQQSQTMLLIDQMQPAWLQTRFQTLSYKISIAITIALITLLVTWFQNEVQLSDKSLINLFWIFCWFFGGIAAALWASLASIQPIESLTLNWSWKRACEEAQSVNYNPILSSAFWPLYGFFSHKIEKKVFPNQGIWKSAKNAFSFTLIGASIPLIFHLLLDYEQIKLFVISLKYAEPLVEPSFFAIFTRRDITWLFLGLPFGGLACIQHFILRLVLYCSGSAPWNYTRFLDYTVERILLQKIGGGYIFIHRLLQEYFAQLKLK